jgi:hypothetical protein
MIAGLIDAPGSARMNSFSAHAILRRYVRAVVPRSCFAIKFPVRRGDEPMVVLDTHLDWRFAKNVCPPPISFIARDGLNSCCG